MCVYIYISLCENRVNAFTERKTERDDTVYDNGEILNWIK